MTTTTSDTVKFGPDDLGAGGLFDDFDGTITEAVFDDTFDYRGKLEEPIVTLRLTIDNPEAEEPIIEQYPVGVGFVVHPEDRHLLVHATAADAHRRISKRSKLGIFSTEAVNAGIPATEVTADSRVFEGLSGHFLKKAVGKGDKGYEVLVLSSVTWPKAAGKAASKTKGKASRSTSRTNGSGQDAGDHDEKAREVLLAALMAAEENTILRKGLTMTAFKAAKAAGLKGAERSAVVARVVEEDFLATGGDDWTVDDTRVSA